MQPGNRSLSVENVCGACAAQHAQQIANHESPRTTKLYDRTNDPVSLDEIERILI
jgi:hypothetical protein